MKTDYQNLNSFELCVVIFIAVGLLLIGAMLFSALTIKQQSDVLSSLNIFDVHDQVAQSAQDAQTILAMPQEFYSQFYLAFTQVAVLPEATVDDALQLPSNIKVAYSQFLNLSDQIIIEHNFTNQPEHQITYREVTTGTVAGASIDLTAKAECAQNPNPPPLIVPYGYNAPTFNQLKQLIKVEQFEQ